MAQKEYKDVYVISNWSTKISFKLDSSKYF